MYKCTASRIRFFIRGYPAKSVCGLGRNAEWTQTRADFYDFRRPDIIDSSTKTLFECINV